MARTVLPSLSFTGHLPRPLMGALAVVLLLLVAGCQGEVAPPPSTTPESASSAGVGSAAAASVPGEIVDVPPLGPDETTGPVQLRIPAINLDVPVIAMGWRLEVVDGERTTVWDVPFDEAGWHMNSAGAGGAGNTIISGRQVGGAAVFAPLALGSILEGQDILLTDGDGIVFVYRVTEVTEPIPITGATPDQQAQAAAYFQPTDNAQLTLVTGWPEFTTTHRVFAVADFVGILR